MGDLELLVTGWTSEEIDCRVPMGDGGYIEVIRDRIVAWCLNRDSERVTVQLENFRPELGIRLFRSAHMVHAIHKEIYSRFRHHDWDHEADKPPNVVKRRPQFYYNEGEPYLIIRPPNMQMAREIADFLRSGTMFEEGNKLGLRLDVSGDEVPFVDQFIQRMDTWSQGWLVLGDLNYPRRVVGEEARVSRINCQEYIVDYRGVKSSKNTYPVNPWILAYDLEVQSGDGHSFPQANLISDYVGMASVVVWRYGLYASTRIQYMIVKAKISPLEGVNVICVETEEEVMKTLENIIARHVPNVITHYNGDSFDNYYLCDRHYRLDLDWSVMGMHKSRVTREIDLWPSMNGRFMRGKCLAIPGVGNHDVMKHVIENIKLRSYSLDAVSRALIGRGKVDIGDYKEIFRAFKVYDETGDNTLIDKIARYGMEDSCLTAEDYEQQKMFDVLVEMSQASEVTSETYVSKGRMKRTQAMMRKMARKVEPRVQLGTGMRARPQMISGGGLVAVPKVGLYDYVFTLDFASLYPSIIISFWLCYTTLLSSVAASMSFEELAKAFPNGIKKPEDIRHVRCDQEDGTYRYKFVKTADPLLPKILMGLLARRSAAKKAMGEAEKMGDTVLEVLLNIKQLAIKIAGNSVYGFTGAPGAEAIPELTQVVTSLGRMLITLVRLTVKEVFGYDCVYGDTDSVMVNCHDAKSYPDALAKATKIRDYLNNILAWVDTDDNGDLYIIPENKREGIPKKVLSLTLEKIARAGFITGKAYYMVYTDMSHPDVPLRRKIETPVLDENGEQVYNKDKTKRVTYSGPLAVKPTGVPSVKRDKAIAFCKMYDKVGHAMMDNQKLRYINELVWDEAIKVVYDLSHPSLSSVPYSGFAHSGRCGKVYEDGSSAAMAHLYHRLARENTPLSVGVRFDYYISDRLGAEGLGVRLVTGDEIEANRAAREKGSDVEPIRVDRLYCYEKRFVPTIDSMIRAIFRPEYQPIYNEQCDRAIGAAMRKTYLTHGRELLDVLRQDENPIIALSCYGSPALQKTFKAEYSKKRAYGLLSDEPARAALAYFEVRGRVLSHIRSIVRE